MSMKELIGHKRDGGALSPDDIRWIISSFTSGGIDESQMSALLMAIYYEGLDSAELAAWTEAMLLSGDRMDFSDIAAPKIDKHSTGGVGDKVSVPLAPMVAACGVAVPMMSGRGLGHTGGTLDKLESIAGFRAELTASEFRSVLEAHGLVLAGQSDTMVPADKKIYDLRDRTGTVPSDPLIISSIMSKKLAEGLDGLVLDVKVGRGAFKKDRPAAEKLAATMVDVGESYGTKVRAVLTAMDQPLGRAVGNANEIAESIEVLRGGGPPDLVAVTYRLGEEMLLLAGLAESAAAARRRLEDAVESGDALAKLVAVIDAQGGDPSQVAKPSRLPQAAHVDELMAPGSGYVTACDALVVGYAAGRLGAGKANNSDRIDHAVGFEILAKVGDEVHEGQPLARILWNDRERFDAAMKILPTAWVIGDDPPPDLPLILGDVR